MSGGSDEQPREISLDEAAMVRARLRAMERDELLRFEDARGRRVALTLLRSAHRGIVVADDGPGRRPALMIAELGGGEEAHSPPADGDSVRANALAVAEDYAEQAAERDERLARPLKLVELAELEAERDSEHEEYGARLAA